MPVCQSALTMDMFVCCACKPTLIQRLDHAGFYMPLTALQERYRKWFRYELTTAFDHKGMHRLYWGPEAQDAEGT